MVDGILNAAATKFKENFEMCMHLIPTPKNDYRPINQPAFKAMN